jgi:hypothetical protein
MAILLVLLLAFSFGLQSVQCSPIESQSVNVCKVVNHIVSILKAKSATPFCSSFLSIPVSTAVSTIPFSVTVVQTTSPLTVATTTDYTVSLPPFTVLLYIHDKLRQIPSGINLISILTETQNTSLALYLGAYLVLQC